MNTDSKRSNRFGSTSEMIIQINTAGMVGKIIVILIAILTILIIGCDMNAGYQQEEEPNGTFETATEFQMSEGSWAGNITANDDLDYFALYLSAGRTYRLTLRDLSSDLDLMLYDYDDETPSVLGSSSNTGITSETVEFSTDALGWYYVLVEVADPYSIPDDTFISKYVVDLSRLD